MYNLPILSALGIPRHRVACHVSNDKHRTTCISYTSPFPPFRMSLRLSLAYPVCVQLHVFIVRRTLNCALLSHRYRKLVIATFLKLNTHLPPINMLLCTVWISPRHLTASGILSSSTNMQTLIFLIIFIIGSSRFSIIAHIAHSLASSSQMYFQLLPVLSLSLIHI